MSLIQTIAIGVGLPALALGVIAVIRRRDFRAAWFLAGMSALAAESAFLGLSLRTGDVREAAFWMTLTLLAGSFLPGAWLCFSLTYARGNYRVFLGKWRWALAAAFLLPPGIVIAFHEHLVHLSFPDLAGTPAAVWFGGGAKALNLALLVAAVLVLVNLEKTFRAAVGTTRWRVKFLFLGLAVVFGAQIYTLSQALLYSEYGPGVAAVKSASLLVACALIFVAYTRDGLAELDLYPSLEFLRGSATIVLAGGYLLTVGVLAKVVSRLGGAEHFPAQAFVIFVGIAGLAVLLMSDRVRLGMQRFISRHFKRPQHNFRRIWTRFSQDVSCVPERYGFCVAAARLISEIFEALSVTVLVVSEDESALVRSASTAIEQGARVHPDARALDLAAIEAGLSGENQPFFIDGIEASWARSLCRATPARFEKGGRRVCVPLRSGGKLHGVVLLADRVRGIPYTHEELELLACIGVQITAGLDNLRLTADLMRAKEMEAFQAMSTFFVHDMKNTATSLNLTLENLPRHMDDPAFRSDALRAISKAVARINHLTERLKSFRRKLEVEPVETDLNELVEETLADLVPGSDFEIVKELHPVPKIAVDREQIRNVVTNLVLNARAAVAAGGRVCIGTSEEKGHLVLAVEDDGHGMSAEFIRESLFQPFRTTKKEGLGIGLFQSKMIVEAHRGHIQVESEPRKGTIVRVSLPGAGN